MTQARPYHTTRACNVGDGKENEVEGAMVVGMEEVGKIRKNYHVERGKRKDYLENGENNLMDTGIGQLQKQLGKGNNIRQRSEEWTLALRRLPLVPPRAADLQHCGPVGTIIRSLAQCAGRGLSQTRSIRE